MQNREKWNKEDARLATAADLLREDLIRKEAEAVAAHETSKPFNPEIRNMMAEGFHQERQKPYQPQRDFGLPGAESQQEETNDGAEPRPQPKPAGHPRKSVGLLTKDREK